ncbi:kinase-like protein [Aspergillus costaricaensis CBS 115574]|uniref:Kinase-like protein n=1 Tax=Aspergillus costaricaensis CBS 115574 TaxID=1448317 RepID=A0ACD1I562_9EURO|nr:kinase-like protein [Aspergillus costaricaensis CBS 115574]RAK85462.1 kinase-like protein [Aspergillus costaricaensis CBS 115574]
MKILLQFSRFSRLPVLPRRAMSSSCPILDSTKKLEEEQMPAYERGLYCSVKPGDVFHSRYQVISKLGFGANSTVWFGRDLQHHRYIALKIYISSSRDNQEVRVLEHLSRIKSQHPGSSSVRQMIEKFELTSPKGIHQRIVYEPLLTSLLHFQATLDPMSLPEDLLKGALQQLLLALDNLHSEAHVIHTDIQAKNIIIAAKDESVFREWDDGETNEPSPRKVDNEYTVYQSRPFRRKKGWSGFGMPLLTDFGEVRLGEVHEGLIQPDLYCAPEVILGMSWTAKVDIWNVGVMIWDLFEDHHLFDGRGPDGCHSDVQLLAEMVAMLGPPSVEWLRKSPRSLKEWDSSGQWKASKEIPSISLADSEEYLEGESKQMFMNFMRKMLLWDPEERQSARELLTDPWLTSP